VSGCVLVGDVGGTNARFALSDGPGRLRDFHNYRVEDYPSITDALTAFLVEVGMGGRASRSLTAVRIAAAGPIDENDSVSLTNAPWRFSEADISRVTGVPARLFNDLEAVALALPHFSDAEFAPFGGSIADPLGGNRLTVNVGTGFGVAAAVATAGSWSSIACEGGHMTFAARTAAEEALLPHLQSIEDVLSGDGLGHLYKIVGGPQAPDTPPSEISASTVLSRFANDPAARDAIMIFSDILARICGDLVLAHGAWGGVFLTGSVALAWARIADQARFRDIFASKGKMARRMKRVPTRLIVAPQPALLGLSYGPSR
jgi:glucokinase